MEGPTRIDDGERVTVNADADDPDEDAGWMTGESDADDDAPAEETDRSVVLRFRESASSTLDDVSGKVSNRAASAKYRESAASALGGISDRAPDREAAARYRESARSRVDGVSVGVPDRSTAERYRESAERRVVALPLAEGFVFGVVAFLLGYVLTVVATASTRAGVGSEEAPGVLTHAAWSFLATLGVRLDQGGEVVSVAEVAGSAVEFAPVMALVTVSVITAAGYLLVRYTGADGVERAVETSVLVVTGYVVLAPTLALLATWTPGSGATVSPAVVDALIYAGVLVPASFGLVGGLAASWPEPIDRAIDLVGRVVDLADRAIVRIAARSDD